MPWRIMFVFHHLAISIHFDVASADVPCMPAMCVRRDCTDPSGFLYLGACINGAGELAVVVNVVLAVVIAQSIGGGVVDCLVDTTREVTSLIEAAGVLDVYSQVRCKTFAGSDIRATGATMLERFSL
jgi:hypothetical protein